MQFTLLNCSLFGLGLYLFLKIKSKGIQKCGKEIAVFLFFYVPALIYDLIRPWEIHFWYNYIFILPTALLISFSLTQLPKFFKSSSIKLLTNLTIFFILIFLTINNVKSFYNSKEIVQKSSQIGHYQNFNALKKLYSSWSDKINIPIDQISNRTFIEGLQSLSPNLFHSSISNKNIESKKYDNNKIKTCFYILDDKYISQTKQKTYQNENKRLNIFLTDPTIKIISVKNHLMKDKGLFKISQFRQFRFYEYKPKFNQPCYQNPWDTFTSSQKDEKLLNNYFQFQKNGNTFFDKNFELDSSDNLKNLKINYIFINDSLKYPIRFKIQLDKMSDDYNLKISIDSYAWGISKKDKFNFNNLSFTILTNQKENKKFELISKNSFISHGLGINKDKFHWYRNYKLGNDFDFSKNQYSIKVFGKINFIARKEQTEKNIKFIIPLELYKKSNLQH